MTIRAVFFDVGETLLDLSGIWEGWARWFNVPLADFVAELSRRVERDEDYLLGFQAFRDGFNLDLEEAARREAGLPNTFSPRDLFPDALPCLFELKRRGYTVGISGNQTLEAEALLQGFGFPADILASSASWKVEKPSPLFFQRIRDSVGLPPGEIAYVGDRVDHDVLPACHAGMVSVFLRRGLWGTIHARLPQASLADLQIDSLAELPARLAKL